MKKLESLLLVLSLFLLLAPFINIQTKFTLTSFLLVIYCLLVDRMTLGIFLALFFRPIGAYIGIMSELNFINGRSFILLGILLIFSKGYKKIYSQFLTTSLPIFLLIFCLVFIILLRTSI